MVVTESIQVIFKPIDLELPFQYNVTDSDII